MIISKNFALRMCIIGLAMTLSYYMYIKSMLSNNSKSFWRINSLDEIFESVREDGSIETAPDTARYNWSKKGDCGKNWAILTTIFAPSDDVKYLSDSAFGWCILVVGDGKTPPNWAYKDVLYLGIDKQELLARKYTLLSRIPMNSYLRKMIGYLYAIESGAEIIYETDDDNAPLDGLYAFRRTKFYGLEAK